MVVFIPETVTRFYALVIQFTHYQTMTEFRIVDLRDF